MMSAISYDGKIILENKNKLFFAPNGNGGIYEALGRSQLLNEMKSLGIQYITFVAIDNCLAKGADPKLIGFMIKKNLDVGSKYLAKSCPEEKVRA